jgi:Type II secretion system (T2SS), protein E, N-terminal domain
VGIAENAVAADQSGAVAIDTDSQPSPARLDRVPQYVRPFIGAILVARGLIAQQQLDEALDEGTRTGERLGDVLVRRGWIFEQELAAALALQYGLDYADLDAVPADPRAAALLDPKVGVRFRALPLRIRDDGAVVVAVADPTQDVVSELEQALSRRVELVVAEWSLIQEVWARLVSARA